MKKILIFAIFIISIVFVVRILYSLDGVTYKENENRESADVQYSSIKSDTREHSIYADSDGTDLKEELLINESNFHTMPTPLDKGSSVTEHKLDIYMMYNRYSTQTRNELKKRGVQPFVLIASSTIDPDNTNKFDSVSVRNFLDKAFPDKNHSEIFVVDWEKELYDWLKLPATDKRFVIAQNEFARLVSFIRALRPNLKIGIYGLPFRVYADKIRNINGPDFKFKKVLDVCDFVAPSFYFMYLDEEIGKNKHDLIFRNNIELSLEYGEILDKPVIPFIWELVHPNNKRFSNELVPLSEFVEKIDLIKSINHNGKSINAVLWWTPSKLPEKYLSFSKSRPRNLNDVRDSISLNYLNSVINR